MKMNKHKIYAIKDAPKGLIANLGKDIEGNEISDEVVFIIFADEVDGVGTIESDAKIGMTTGLCVYYVTMADLRSGAFLFSELSTDLV